MATYYVDATGGDDTKAGTTEATAWKTIGKLNGETFSAGDRILLKRGETWTGTRLVTTSSGASGNPIIYGAYGTGDRPLIDGNDAVNQCINTSGKNHLTFQYIAVCQGLNQGFYIASSDNVTMTECVAYDCGVDNVLIDNSSNVTVTGGSFYSVYERVPPTCGGNISCQDGSYSVEIDGAVVYGALGTDTHGINFHNHAGTAMMYNITIKNCTVYSNADHGIYIWKLDDAEDSDHNILIENCTVYGNGDTGLRLRNSGANYLTGAVIRDNVIRDNTTREAEITVDNASIYRNLMKGIAPTPVKIVGCKDLNLWNNTFYTTAAVSTEYLVRVEGARTEDFLMKNNIMAVANAAVYMLTIIAGTGTTGMDIDYNLYSYTGVGTRWTWLSVGKTWANWKADSGQDANSPTPADPLFTSVATEDFTLQSGSPAINAGVDVGLIYHESAPDLGAYEYIPPVPTIRNPYLYSAGGLFSVPP